MSLRRIQALRVQAFRPRALRLRALRLRALRPRALRPRALRPRVLRPRVLRLQVLRSLLAAIILLACLPAWAQAQSISIRFDNLSVEDGLSQSTVRAILQDTQGFMWFGTDDGLNKYDGYTFTLYKHDAEIPDSLSDNAVTALYQDSRGDLWIGATSGLDRLERGSETFEHFQPAGDRPDAGRLGNLRGASVSAIAEDTQGGLWVGTADGGLSLLDRANARFVNYTHDEKRNNSLASDAVRALLPDDKGGLWVGTDKGLDYFDPRTSSFTHYRSDTRSANSLSSDSILALYMDHAGSLWVGTEEGGLNRLNLASGAFTRYLNRPDNPYSLSNNNVHAISEDKNGQIWVGGRDGLNRFRRDEDYFIRYQHDPNDPHSLSNNYILSLYVDRSGVVWIGTFGGGLSKYVQNNERFTLYQHQPGVSNSLSNDIVYAICEDREGVVWVGTMDGGLNRLDNEALTFSVFQNHPSDPASLSSNDVRAIFEDRLGGLWVGTNGGLNKLDRNTNTFTHFLHDSNLPATISDNRVTAISEDHRGNLWIGTRAGGLELLNRDSNTFTHFRHVIGDPTSLTGDTVHVIYEDRGGSLWLGTNSGISVMDPQTMRFRNYLNDPKNRLSLSDNRVMSILETPDNTVWIGTMLGGLNRFDRVKRTFRQFTQKQGLPGDAIYGILADRSGYLWLSTNHGLSRFDPRAETFRNYDRSDGLQSFEFNPGASFQDSRGRMFFGGIQGFNSFDPNRMEDNLLPPPIIITAFNKLNKTERKDLASDEKINLTYLDNFISFEFAALDYSAPGKNQYAYKLDGFDKDWVYAGTRRYASYTNLRGGTYIFRVKGSNQDGVWNEEGASVDITVVPPLWQNVWFIGSAVLILLLAAIIIYRLRLMRVQEQTRTLEEQVHERTREIERRREVAEGLREILTILNSNRSLKESLDAIILQIVRLMDARVVLIFRIDDEGYPVVVATNLQANYGKAGELPLPPLPGWLTSPILEQKAIALPDLIHQRQADPNLALGFFGHYAALLAVPLLINDKVDGGLVMLYSWARDFTDEDMQMAVSFANHTALAIANAQLRSQAEELAVSAERSRLARDLHDAVTQTLFATSLIAEVLPKLWERNPEVGKQKVTEIRELTRGALAEMRTLLMELRPTALMDVPLPDLLQQLSEAFTGRARVPVTLEVDRSLALPANVKIGFYRIAQEALNNIQKHSHANQVELSIQDAGDQVELCIHDDGIGFDTNRKLSDHFGLGIMEERAQSIGAQFALKSQPNEGTKITVIWQK